MLWPARLILWSVAAAEGAFVELAAVQAVSVSLVTAAAREDPGRPRHWRAEAAIWTVSMAALVTATVVGGGHSSYLALDISVGVVSVLLVPFLARWPVQTALLLSVLSAVSPAATPPATMAALIVARWQRLSLALAVAGTGVAAHLVRGVWRPLNGLPYVWWTVLILVAYAALVGWGTLIRANRALISSLRERAERAEADQSRRVAEARAAERAMIAREMHDVLAHRLSLLATYAGALAYRPDAPPAQLSSAAEVIRSGVHESLDELREVIGVLRDDTLPDLVAGRAPLPGIARLPELVEESRAAGMSVTTGGPAWPAGDIPQGSSDALGRSLPDALGRTVYRVVQEGLTNARKHAPGQPVQVTLDGGPGPGLEVAVVNQLGPTQPAETGRAAGRLPGTGTGLIGLTERLELAGGRLSFGAQGGEFRLRAWLPWPQAAEDSTTQASPTEASPTVASPTVASPTEASATEAG
jgi:signal transduction histidine kinase